MADQVQQTAKGAGEKTGGAASGGVQSATGGILNSIQGMGTWVAQKGKDMLDRVFPPEQRASILARIQAFMLSNPKLSAFLGMNFALTGVPLGLFALFTLTIAVFALVVGLLLGLLAAVLFIVFAVGVALMFVLPTIFFTTMAATFLFLWGLGGYYIIKAFTSSEDAGKEAPEGGAIGDKINNLTGGRLTGFMDSAKKEKAKGDMSGWGDQHTKPQANGSAQKQDVRSPKAV